MIKENNRALWCYMYSLVGMLCMLQGQIGLICLQLLHDLHAADILWFTLLWKSFIIFQIQLILDSIR